MPDEQISRFLGPAIISLQSYWYIRCSLNDDRPFVKF